MEKGIVEKLKIEDASSILILSKPNDIHLFNRVLFDTKEKKEKYNIIIIFIFSIDEFVQNLRDVIKKDMLYPDGYLYFIYPKKGNKKYKEYIGRDDFFGPAEMNNDGYAFQSRLKFNKMLSFDETFTLIGLKYVEKERKTALVPSQRVADYINRIPELKEHLVDSKEVLKLFNELSPGYQRGWARFVFSTKSEETKRKRLSKMEEVLKAGYKSIDLYRMKNR